MADDAVVADLRTKMLNGHKEEVIGYLQRLPQGEADRLRWLLVKDLERITKRKAAPAAAGRRAPPKGRKAPSAKGAATPPAAARPAAAPAGDDDPEDQDAAPAGGKGKPAAGDEDPEEGGAPAGGKGKAPRVIGGRYQMGEAVGRGGFATVYRALDTERGDFVAVKEIEKRLLAPDQLPKIMQEAELLKTLSHENIVGFRASLESPKHIHFVLEFVEGGSLYRVVKKYGTFTEKLCAIYMRQTVLGLQYLHTLPVPILHRDVKGANLLLTKEGQVKLADFGACTYAALNKNLTVVGTPFWMAPEIIEIAADAIGTAADIWSLGCTVLELMTGNPPYFHLGTMQCLFKMVEDAHPPLADSFSPDLRDFLLRCFSKDVKRRATATQLLTHTWLASNTAQSTRVTREQLQGTLKAINRPERTNVKGLFDAAPAVAAAPLSTQDKALTARLHQTKESLKALLAEQQAVQREIVAAQKRKAALEQSVAALRRSVK